MSRAPGLAKPQGGQVTPLDIPDGTATIQSMFDLLKSWGAAKMEVVIRDDADVAVRAVIVVEGVAETAEILAATEAVQKSWDAES